MYRLQSYFLLYIRILEHKGGGELAKNLKKAIKTKRNTRSTFSSLLQSKSEWSLSVSLCSDVKRKMKDWFFEKEALNI